MTTDLQPWHWRSLPLESRTGSEVFDYLFRNTNTIATLLESPYPTPQDQPLLARYSICAGMPRTYLGRNQMWTPAIGEILPFLRRLLASNRNNLASAPHHLPFTGGWLGWLGYDLAWEIEQLPRIKPDPLPFPVTFWYEPAAFAVLDHSEQTLWLAATSEPELDQLQKRLEQSFPIPNSPPPTSSPLKLTMKPLLYKPKNISKLVIFFRQIFPSGLKSRPNLQVGQFIELCNKLILHPLPAFGKPLGGM